MNRRKMILTLVTAGSTGSIIGTGAFSSMESGDRIVAVDVVEDSQAYLALRPNDHYNTTFLNDDGKLTVSLGGTEGRPGVNPGSAYRIGMVRNQPLKDRSAPETVLPTDDGIPVDDPAFSIANQSNQPQDVNILFQDVSGTGSAELYFQFAPSYDGGGAVQTFRVTPSTDERDYTFPDVPVGEFIAASLLVDATDANMEDSVAFSMSVSAN